MAAIVNNPAVRVNNSAIAVRPNSVKFVNGDGEAKMRIQSAGGGNVQHVYAKDVDTLNSKVTFSMLNTDENMDLVRNWKLNEDRNAITITQAGLLRAFPQMAIVNDPENETGADSDIMVEFEGAPAVS